MTQYYDIKTYKQYDRDVKLAVRRGLDMEQLLTVVDMLRKGETLPPSTATTCSQATTKATGSATSIPTGCCSTRKTPKSASYPFTGREHIPTFLAKGRKDNPPCPTSES